MSSGTPTRTRGGMLTFADMRGCTRTNTSRNKPALSHKRRLRCPASHRFRTGGDRRRPPRYRTGVSARRDAGCRDHCLRFAPSDGTAYGLTSRCLECAARVGNHHPPPRFSRFAFSRHGETWNTRENTPMPLPPSLAAGGLPPTCYHFQMRRPLSHVFRRALQKGAWLLKKADRADSAPRIHG